METVNEGYQHQQGALFSELRSLRSKADHLYRWAAFFAGLAAINVCVESVGIAQDTTAFIVGGAIGFAGGAVGGAPTILEAVQTGHELAALATIYAQQRAMPDPKAPKAS
jgi:hypothetical protein